MPRLFRRRTRPDGGLHQAPADWDLEQDAHQGVYMTDHVFAGRLPVLRVVHDGDGDLQILDNVHEVDTETAHLVCLHHAVETHDLREVIRNLPINRAAEREAVGSPWLVCRDGGD